MISQITYRANPSNGLIKVRFSDNSWGFVNMQGYIFAKGFYHVWPFENGLAEVNFGPNSWGFLDLRGNLYEKNKKILIDKNDFRFKKIKINSLSQKLDRLLKI